MAIDFTGLAAHLLARAPELLMSWLPGGKLKSSDREYYCAGIQGGPGESLKVNTKTGKWSDFATGAKGRDLISLYAQVRGLKNGPAAIEVAKSVSYDLGAPPARPGPARAGPEAAGELLLTQPPPDAGPPDWAKYDARYKGPAVAVYCYRDGAGVPINYIARYEPKDDKKQFIPQSWCQEGRWIPKAWPTPRPLYGLELLAARPDAPVIVVEGEGKCEALRTLCGETYVVVCWSGGSSSVSGADWRTLLGRKVILWPDSDDAGRKAMDTLSRLLKDIAAEVKLIKTTNHDGWDCGDAVKAGWDWDQVVTWIRERIVLVNAAAVPLTEAPVPAPTPTPGAVSQVAMTGPDGEALLVTAAAKDGKAAVAVQNLEEGSPSTVARWEQLGIMTNGNGAPIMNTTNASRICANDPKLAGKIWFDVFHDRVLTNMDGPARPWTDADTGNLQVYVQGTLGLSKMGKDTVLDGLMHYARLNQKNEPLDWVRSLKWDGQDRLATFLMDYLGVVPTPYTTAVSKNFWIAMVARISDPGCQVDNMLMLYGGQGVGKSTTCRIIGGAWHTEAGVSADHEEFYNLIQGKMLIEFSEMVGGKADAAKLKQVVSCQRDRFRQKYGRIAEDHPRRCVFIATFNNKDVLKDDTGARRYWPVEVGVIDIEALKRDREQLFAEAYARYAAGEKWHEVPLDEARIVQEEYRQVDVWEDLLMSWVHQHENNFHVGEPFTTAQIAEGALSISASRLDYAVQRRIGSILHAHGFRQKTRTLPGKNIKVWVRNETKDLRLGLRNEKAPESEVLPGAGESGQSSALAGVA